VPASDYVSTVRGDGVRARCRCSVRAGQRSTFCAEEVGDETASGGDCLTPRQRGRLATFPRFPATINRREARTRFGTKGTGPDTPSHGRVPVAQLVELERDPLPGGSGSSRELLVDPGVRFRRLDAARQGNLIREQLACFHEELLFA
jgi:hypothetical protein